MWWDFSTLLSKRNNLFINFLLDQNLYSFTSNKEKNEKCHKYDTFLKYPFLDYLLKDKDRGRYGFYQTVETYHW